MKSLKFARGRYGFQINGTEKKVLFTLLRLYPLIPSAHHRLSKTEERADDQLLLEESLAEQRQENHAQLTRLLQARGRFRKNEKGYRFSLKSAELEWLLQVLNDVRVGSWLALGSPDGAEEILAALNATTAPQLWAMDMAGGFQMVFLSAFKGDAKS